MFNVKSNDNFELEDSENARDLYDQSIIILNLKKRAYHGLRLANVDTIGDLCNLTRDELKTIKDIGMVSVLEIEKKLSELGLKLND